MDGKKVLVIEDSKLWREFLRKELEKEGFTVDTAEDGLEGLNKFFEFMPDAVVTDFVMPKMNGIHVCRIIKAYTSFQKVGVVILTGIDESINKFWAEASGADLFLSKGLRREELIKKLISFLKGPYIISWSREVYKIRKQPFGELVDILDETLKFETIRLKILELTEFIEDEFHLLKKLYELFKQLFIFDSMHLLLLSTTTGRLYSFSKKEVVYNDDFLLNKMYAHLKRPITPSKWIYRGNYNSNGETLEDFEIFLIERNNNEHGVILFENATDKDLMIQIVSIANNALSMLFNVINNYNEYKDNSEIDFLSNVSNKRVITNKLEEYSKLAQRQDIPLSVAMIDIDDFKRVNDKYGHTVGDEVLKEFARIIKNNLRESDLVGRFGGEEFLVIFPGTPAENAKEVLQRVLEKVRNYNWQKYGIDKLTFSAGVTSNVKGSVTDIIDRADQNLYKAKKSGKNKVVGGD